MNQEFKPYVPADKVTPEMTLTSIIMGLLLAVIFGAANAYLGLRVGMTVSASIPAAVISMAVIRVILKKDSILESNMVQTIGSAGESLAAGAIFTMPALFLWAKEGVMETPSLVTITVIALFGGLLGVFFMVPLRSALIVQEHGVLPYPEGTACAEVLLAGEEGGSSAKSVFIGMGIGAVVKLLVDGFYAIQGVVTLKLDALKTELSAEVYPALVSVGYICGARISAYMFAGGVIGWFVLIPAIVTFGGDIVMYPASVSVAELYATGGASAIWASYIKYIGAGAVASAGIISLIKTLPLIVKTFMDSIKSIKNAGATTNERTALDMDIRFVLGAIVVLIIAIWLVPAVPVSLLGAIIIVVFGFFFSAVSSRMVGLVGSSNNPVSGMTIATILIATICLKVAGDTGAHGMQGAIAIGSIICIAACMAGDTSQDLKTGYILGATPKKQQYGEIMGTIAAALAIGGVMILLNSAYGFGTDALAAPQATMMKMIIEGVMNGNLPWALIFIGAFISIAVEILGIGALPVAIGLYLPLELSSTIMLGGLVRLFTDKKRAAKNENGKGILFCSGLIAGEGIVGVLLAIFAVTGLLDKMNLSSVIPSGNVQAFILLALVVAAVWYAAKGKKNEK
ncbi:OPT family oligopeptide transporter [Pseudobutyrivibrio ruminis]|uniref:Putative oligopeptide transporter, OPT family n=1 Tax=Pseudobutyrivibrio ruminis DSM 9787 TaxID=1123011 RepID=A0A285S401_9FIRM|nr:oligopeptide transporter, OPT family [Pseudobutyrivibrio ruminis]SOC01721.1 putative oligopeptide transporter, OPT family [Pseudobutyrivibrio ruminis DSM 9787]